MITNWPDRIKIVLNSLVIFVISMTIVGLIWLTSDTFQSNPSTSLLVVVTLTISALLTFIYFIFSWRIVLKKEKNNELIDVKSPKNLDVVQCIFIVLLIPAMIVTYVFYSFNYDLYWKLGAIIIIGIWGVDFWYAKVKKRK